MINKQTQHCDMQIMVVGLIITLFRSFNASDSPSALSVAPPSCVPTTSAQTLMSCA